MLFPGHVMMTCYTYLKRKQIVFHLSIGSCGIHEVIKLSMHFETLINSLWGILVRLVKKQVTTH